MFPREEPISQKHVKYVKVVKANRIKHLLIISYKNAQCKGKCRTCKGMCKVCKGR